MKNQYKIFKKTIKKQNLAKEKQASYVDIFKQAQGSLRESLVIMHHNHNHNT